MQSLFSLDVTGEAFSEPGPEESQDPSEEESAINVRELSDSRVNVLEEEPKLIRIALASHIRDIYNIDQARNPDLSELYRNVTMDIRKFIYNSIVGEDFCLSCRVVKDPRAPGSEPPDLQPDAAKPGEGGAAAAAPAHCEPGPISPKLSMSVDGRNEIMSVEMSDSLESVTSSAPESISSEDSSLASLVLESPGLPAPDGGSEAGGCAGESDSILLELSPSKLNRTVTEMAHVQMRRFFASYPRSFKFATGNVGADVYALGRRYYISSDQGAGQLSAASLPLNHSLYLAHLYRRQRSVCYYCGFLRCARSSSSKNPCEFQKCTKCVGYHRWSRNACKGNGRALEQYLQANDWRARRPNLWAAQPRALREMLRCFYCGNEGEANFKCQGLSCPEGLDSLPVRCLELLGANALRQERRRNPQLFPHLSRWDFVFEANFRPGQRGRGRR